ncbi:EF-P 5-aminopentanol modification-associated protein YfmH [Pediococcus siamensis]|uniref:EF-P 5-aminopentanol modification-associated protein YfmH n=1 Tax=Pediococcus siamensis TaxID=381829 RepID=UPI0039A020B8
MHKREYQQFQETCYTQTLANGLRVNLLPKQGFHKTYAIFTTHFGAIDRTFIPQGQSSYVTQPAGIAHFLEHKLFDQKGYDAFELFGRYGADSNAFTSFTKTSYLFSATQNIRKNLEILLDFVQEPYFTEASVEKEKGIIGQEIQMYDDDPDWQLYMGLLNNLYPKHPVHVDIAGTIDTIQQIQAQDLYLAYRTFYHPQNMDLFVVGNLNPEETLSWIEENQAQKSFSEFKQPQVKIATEASLQEITAHKEIRLAVNRPKAIIGLKGLDTIPDGRAGLAYQIKVNLLLYLLFGESSEWYLQAYNKGIIDDTFSYEFDLSRSFHYVSWSSDTNRPQDFKQAIQTVLKHARVTLPTLEREFTLAKREMLGRLLQRMDAIEAIANSYEGDLFGQTTIFDQAEIYENVTLTDLCQVAEKLIDLRALSTFVIQPKEEAKS